MFTLVCQEPRGVIPHYVYGKEDTPSSLLTLAMARSSFAGNLGDLFYLPALDGPGALLVGLEKDGKVTEEDLRTLGYRMAQALKEAKEEAASLVLPDLPHLGRKALFLALAEGFLQANYSHTFKTQKEEEDPLITISFSCPREEEEEWCQALDHLDICLQGVFLARDLVNATSNHLTPEILADKALAHLAPLGVEVQVHDEDRIRDLGMEAFLSVAKGSDQAPRLLVMTYRGDPQNPDRTALIGKGLTYDSGGYCLKPAAGMETMHSDMAGAATVIGTLYALAKSQAKANVVGVVAACENLISGRAYKTGDVIGSMAGKTIEVANTDAEGRLTLADAVFYGSGLEGVTRVIDLATLTGAVLLALGEEYTGVITNNQAFYEALAQAGEAVGEPLWQLPVNDRFKKMNESKKADLTNSAGRLGGTITAGLFVGEFLAHKDMPWVHMDIAGTSYLSKARTYLPEGATGIHVKTLLKFLGS